MIVCFGEVLVDMIATKPGSLLAAPGFVRKFGGAPANTAIGLAKLGVPVTFIGKCGDDPFGAFLKHILEKNMVKTDLLVHSTEHPTTLAFVSVTEDGGRDFIFYDGAHSKLTPNEVVLPDCDIVHFCSVLQASPEGKAATRKVITQAKKRGFILSYDPNIRLNLWKDPKEAKECILETLQEVDIAKVSDEELLFLTGTSDIEVGSKKLFSPNLDALLVTLGAKGCYYRTKNESGFVKTIQSVHVIDTTGAGDAFNAGYLHMLSHAAKKFSEMNRKELEKGLYQANVIATLTTTKKGAVNAFPDQKTINNYL